MLEWIPPGTELMRDVSPADWILERLRPWDPLGVRLDSFAPKGFEAYARIFHPARPGRSLARWAELGATRGVALTPDVAFCEVSGIDPPDDHALSEIAPLTGELPQATCQALAQVLRSSTQSSERCWFCLWEGNGAFWSSAHTALYEDDATPAAGEQYLADAKEQDEVLRSTPKVLTEHRSYLLFRGPLDSACAFEPAGWYDSPNLWWPDDRSWIVITEVDGFSTYVGASRTAIDDELGSPDLEAISVPHSVYMDPGPYRPRWRTSPE